MKVDNWLLKGRNTVWSRKGCSIHSQAMFLRLGVLSATHIYVASLCDLSIEAQPAFTSCCLVKVGNWLLKGRNTGWSREGCSIHSQSMFLRLGVLSATHIDVASLCDLSIGAQPAFTSCCLVKVGNWLLKGRNTVWSRKGCSIHSQAMFLRLGVLSATHIYVASQCDLSIEAQPAFTSCCLVKVGSWLLKGRNTGWSRKGCSIHSQAMLS